MAGSTRMLSTGGLVGVGGMSGCYPAINLALGNVDSWCTSVCKQRIWLAN